MLKAAPIPTERRDFLPSPKDYFIDEVVQQLLADPRLGESRAERREAVFEGGLSITTTLSPRMQFASLVAVAEEVPDTEGRFTASVVSIEPSTGAVRALVGGEGFEEAQFNIATRGIGRQPGSAFKPFIMATHIENGGTPLDTIDGIGPCQVPNPDGEPDPYEVRNFDNSRGSVMDMRRAMVLSNNCAFTRLGLIAGLDRVVEVTEALGVTSPIAAVPSMSLGTNEIRPIDMAAAYATFANGGVYNEPYFIEEVLDRTGEVILAHEPDPRQAISADTAAIVTDLLASNVESGTGTRARFPDGRPAAGKTGTTQDFADAWFVGYVPQMATAVWMGSPRGNEDKMVDVAGIRRITGGSFPSQIWAKAMHAGLAESPPVPFPPLPEVADGNLIHLPGEEPLRQQAVERRPVRRAAPAPQRTTAPAPTPAPAPAPTAAPTTAPPTTAAPAPTAPPSGGGGQGPGGDGPPGQSPPPASDTTE